MPRRYHSDLRDQRMHQTRSALLDACEQLLLELPVEEVTLPAVAQRAGVTKPTAYSHFPDNDALMAGFLHHLRDRIGMDHETLAHTPPSELPDAVRGNYARYERDERLMLRVMDSPSYNRVRLARNIDRQAVALSAWNEPHADRALRARLGPIYLLVGPLSWRWLRETWGLSGADATRAAAWAMKTLVEAAGDAPRSERRTRRTNAANAANAANAKPRRPKKTKTTKKEKRP